MPKVAITTDTNSGLTASLAKELGVYSIPMPFVIDGHLYYEGVDLTRRQFYDQLRLGKEVSTSQPALGHLAELWELLFAQGYEEIVYIPMSSGLSSSCNSAQALAEDYEGRVQVVDNHRISVTLRQSVVNAVDLAASGFDARAIKRQLQRDAYLCSIYICLDTLHYLKKGGRVTASGAAIGTVLNIKPVLTIQGDKLEAYAKVHGMRAGRRAMVEAIEKDLAGRFQQLYKENRLVLFIADSFVAPEGMDSWRQEVSEAFPNLELIEDHLTLSIGCHIGPGALGVAICQK